MVSGHELYSLVSQIAAFGERRSGTEAERRAMEFICLRLQQIGLADARIEWFDMHQWTPLDVKLEALPENISMPCKPVWYSASTPAGGLTADCSYCGFGFPQEFASAQGKIAVMEGRTLLHFLPTYRFFQSYDAAVTAGVLALVILGDTPADLIPIFTADEQKHDNPIPAVLTSRSAGDLLRKRMAAGEVKLRLTLGAEAKMGRTGDVAGVLPGQTDEYLIVGAHHDSIYQGAVDNAAGVAVLLALAGELAGRPKPPRKSIVFATHPGHELLVGSREFVKNHASILPKAAAYITLDGIGCDNYQEIGGNIVRTDRDEIRGIFISPNRKLAEVIFPAVLRNRIQPSALLTVDIMCPNEDLEGRFFEAGVPIIDIIGKPIWYHTEADTPEKLSPEKLERGLRAHLEILEALDALPAEEIRAAGKQPFEPQSLITPKQVRQTPAIDFTYLPDKLKAGQPSLIYVSDFTDMEGILVDMKWNIAGETGAKGPAILHVFDQPGRYPVSLTVVNNFGAEGRCERILEVF
jgi:hypothetical protein